MQHVRRPAIHTSLLLAALASILLAGRSSADTQPVTPPAWATAMLSATDPAWIEAEAQARAEAEAAEAALDSPAAIERREQSDGAFSSISDSEIVQLARTSFPEDLTGPTEVAEAALSNGVRVAGYTDQHTAQLVSAAGDPVGTLVSTVPLTTDSSANTGIDLSLESQPDGALVATDPRVDVEIPEDGSDPATVGEAGIAFSPAGADASQAIRRSGRVLYPSIDTDTDYILQPMEQGLEAFWQLRSSDSPETLRLQYKLPAGTTLVERVAPGDAASVTIVRDGQAIGGIKPPSGVDAAGQPVELSMGVVGDDVVVKVNHRSQELQYPLLIDPLTMSWTGTNWAQGSGGYGTCGADTLPGAWGVSELAGFSSPTAFSIPCNAPAQGGYGMWIGSYLSGSYPVGSGVNVSWWAPPNTYISDITWGGLRHINPTGKTMAYAGLYGVANPAWQGTPWINMTSRSAADLSQQGAVARNRALIGLQFPNGGASNGNLTGASWVALWLREMPGYSQPHVLTTSGTLPQLQNQYIDPTVPYTLHASASDASIGLSSLRVIVNGTTVATTGGCSGECAIESTWSLRLDDYASKPDGSWDVTVTATDPAGNTDARHLFFYSDPGPVTSDAWPADDAIDEPLPDLDYPCTLEDADDICDDTPTTAEREILPETSFDGAGDDTASRSDDASSVLMRTITGPKGWGMGMQYGYPLPRNDSRFVNLKLRRARLQVRWDLMRGDMLTEQEITDIENGITPMPPRIGNGADKSGKHDFYLTAHWLREVGRYNTAHPDAPLQPLIGFFVYESTESGFNIPPSVSLPDKGTYLDAINKFRQRFSPANGYPTIKDYIVWNEANRTPAGAAGDANAMTTHPERLAKLYRGFRKVCGYSQPITCHVAAGSFIDRQVVARPHPDQPFSETNQSYLKQFITAVGGAKRVKFWALHTYGTLLADKNDYVRKFMRLTRTSGTDGSRGNNVWFTEGGPWVQNASGGTVSDPTTAKNRLCSFLGRITDSSTSGNKTVYGRVTRFYLYQWKGSSKHFDSGLLDPKTDAERPAYNAYRSYTSPGSVVGCP
jgi:hypothetical protein